MNRTEQLEMRLLSVEAQLLGQAYLLHQFMQVVQRDGLKDKDGGSVNIDWIFIHTAQKLTEAGQAMDDAGRERIADAIGHVEFLRRHW